MITDYIDSYQAMGFDHISCYPISFRPMPSPKSSEKGSSDRKLFGIRLPDELMKDVKHLAVDEGKPMNELVEEALREFLKKPRERRKDLR